MYREARCIAVTYGRVRGSSVQAPFDQAPSELPPRLASSFASSILANHLDQVCRDFEPIDWPCFFAWRRACRAIPARACLLTFDGGLREHAEFAAPLLEERGLRGVFFVPGAALASGRITAEHRFDLLREAWGDDAFARRVYDWLDGHRTAVTAALQDCPHARRLLHGMSAGYAATREGWTRLVDPLAARRQSPFESQLVAELRYLLVFALPPASRDALLDGFFAERFGDPRAFSHDWYMSWTQLDHLHREGHTIGGCGFDHEPYSRLDAATQASDVARCASVLREGLGPALRPFAYPYGVFTETASHSCARRGFTHGFSLHEGWIDANTAPTKLPRVAAARVEHLLAEESHFAAV